MLGVLALLQALEHLVLADGDAELGVAAIDVGLMALELADAHRALRLDVFDERLTCEQLSGAVGDEALLRVGVLEVALHRAQAVAAASELIDRAGELLAREILAALT